jgi:hypothetical protein
VQVSLPPAAVAGASSGQASSLSGQTASAPAAATTGAPGTAALPQGSAIPGTAVLQASTAAPTTGAWSLAGDSTAAAASGGASFTADSATQALLAQAAEGLGSGGPPATNKAQSPSAKVEEGSEE